MCSGVSKEPRDWDSFERLASTSRPRPDTSAFRGANGEVFGGRVARIGFPPWVMGRPFRKVPDWAPRIRTLHPALRIRQSFGTKYREARLFLLCALHTVRTECSGEAFL